MLVPNRRLPLKNNPANSRKLSGIGKNCSVNYNGTPLKPVSMEYRLLHVVDISTNYTPLKPVSMEYRLLFVADISTNWELTETGRPKYLVHAR